MKNQISFQMSKLHTSNYSLPYYLTLGSSVHGQFDGRYPTPTKPLHSHKLLRNSSSKSPSGELYQHQRNNSNNNLSFNVSHLSQNPHSEALTQMRQPTTQNSGYNFTQQQRQDNWIPSYELSHLEDQSLLKPQLSKQQQENDRLRAKSAGRSNIRTRNLNNKSQNARVGFINAGSDQQSQLIFNHTGESEASNLRKSQSFRMKKQNGINTTQTQSKDDDPSEYISSSRGSRHGSQHIATTNASNYLPLKIKMTPRTVENLKNQASQIRTQSSQETNLKNNNINNTNTNQAQKQIGTNDQQYPQQIQQKQNISDDSRQLESMLDGMDKRRLTDAQIRQTRVNQLKSYVASAYNSENPTRKQETPIRMQQKSPQTTTHLLNPNNSSSAATSAVNYRARHGQNERILPMKATKNLADLEVNLSLPRYSPAPSLVEQNQSKSTDEFPGSEFNSRPGSEFNTRFGNEFPSHIPFGGSTSTNTSSLLPIQSLQSKQLRDLMKQGEQEVSVEEMHFYAVSFQQNIKQWMSQIENPKPV